MCFYIQLKILIFMLLHKFICILFVVIVNSYLFSVLSFKLNTNRKEFQFFLYFPLLAVFFVLMHYYIFIGSKMDTYIILLLFLQSLSIIIFFYFFKYYFLFVKKYMKRASDFYLFRLIHLASKPLIFVCITFFQIYIIYDAIGI